MLEAISFLFFTIQNFFASISNDRSNSRRCCFRFIRKRSKRNFTSCLSFHPCLPFSSFLSSYSFLFSLALSFPTFFFCFIFFLINVKYPVAQGLKEIIGKLLYNYLPDNLDLETRVSMNAIHSENSLVVPYKNFYRSSD